MKKYAFLTLALAAAIIIPTPSAVVRAQSVPDLISDLVLYYSFDDASNLAKDSSGNGNDGALKGTVLPIPTLGINEGAAYFNRAGFSGISVPSSAKLGASYTKSVWAYMSKPSGGGAGFISQPGKTSKQHVFMGYGSNSIISSNSYNISNPKITQLITLNSWVNAVTTYDAPTRTLKLYLDGVLAQTLTDVDPIPSDEREIEIGSFATTNSTKTFDGPLDELRVYSRALTDAEVAALHVLDQQSHGANVPPQAANVSISGSTMVGATLTGTYTFFDNDGDAEGISSYRWLRSVTEDGTFTPIVGATAQTYVVTETDVSKFLKFEVTPRALTGETPGVAAASAQREIPEVVTTPPNSTGDISSDLLLHYSFDDANDLGHDESGNSYDGVLAGSVIPTPAVGISGGAAFFNRAGESRIDVPTQAELGESYTKSVWAYMNKPSGGGGGFISHPTKTKKMPVFMGYGSNSIIAANVYSISDPKITRLITLGSWIHAVTTYDAPTQTLKLYLDGVLTDTLTDVDPIAVGDRTMMVGSMPTTSSTRTFDGPLDEVRVYTRALTAEEVAELHDVDLGVVTPPPAPIPAPANVGAIVANGDIAVTFSAVPSAQDYVIQYKVSTDTAYSTFADGVSTQAFATVTGLTASTTYAVRVAAIVGGVTGTYSAPVTVYIPGVVAPPVQHAPTATNVGISGTPQEGLTLTGAYTYVDEDGDAESGTTYRWLRAATTNGTSTAIVGASTDTYVVSAADAGQYISFEVFPRAATGTQNTLAYVSAPVLATAAPVVDPEPGVGYGEDITSGLVLYYSFEDPNNLGKDSSGNGYDGALQGTVQPITATGITGGKAAFFNRAGLSSIAPPAAAKIGESYTKSVWAYINKPAGAAGGFIANPTQTTKYHTLMQYGSNNILLANSYTYANPKITYGVTLGQWYNAVATYDAPTQTLKLYVDGQLIETVTNVPPVAAADRGLLIGSTGTTGATRTFDGPLDEVRVYDRALTPAQIAHLRDTELTQVDTPTAVTIQGLDGKVRVSYAGVTGADDYTVEYKTVGASTYTKYNDGVQNVTAIEVPGLTNGTTYQFRVAAFKHGVISAFTAPVNGVPNIPAETAPTASDVQITGTAFEGEVLTGTYTYFDANGDAEAASTYQWYRAGTTSAPYLPIAGATQQTYAVTQADDRRLLKFEVTPHAATGIATGTPVQSLQVIGDAITRYMHILSTGQSLSLGGNPAFSGVQPYENVGLTTVVENGVKTDYGPFVPLIAVGGERPDIPVANTYAGFSDVDGITLSAIATSHGGGGLQYTKIMKGTDPYNRGMAQAALSKSLAEAEGAIYNPLAIMLIHGEADAMHDTTEYEGQLVELRSDYNTDLSALMGSSVNLPLFFNQTSQSNPNSAALLQLKTQREHDDMYLIGPIYQYKFNADYIHLLGEGSRDVGEQFGKVMYDVMQKGVDWKPLSPTSITRTGAEVLVTFHVPAGTLQFDTTQVAERQAKGFRYFVDGVEKTISSVAIVSGNTVKLTLAAVPTGTLEEVTYALNPALGNVSYGDPADPLAFGGNLRDTDSRVAPGTASSGKPLYNWAVAFRDPVTVTGAAPAESSLKDLTVTPVTTSNTSPALSGTVVGTTSGVLVTVNGQSVAVQVAGSQWVLAAGTLAPLAPGLYSVTLRSTSPEGIVLEKTYQNVITITQ